MDNPTGNKCGVWSTQIVSLRHSRGNVFASQSENSWFRDRLCFGIWTSELRVAECPRRETVNDAPCPIHVCLARYDEDSRSLLEKEQWLYSRVILAQAFPFKWFWFYLLASHTILLFSEVTKVEFTFRASPISIAFHFFRNRVSFQCLLSWEGGKY